MQTNLVKEIFRHERVDPFVPGDLLHMGYLGLLHLGIKNKLAKCLFFSLLLTH